MKKSPHPQRFPSAQQQDWKWHAQEMPVTSYNAFPVARADQYFGPGSHDPPQTD